MGEMGEMGLFYSQFSIDQPSAALKCSRSAKSASSLCPRLIAFASILNSQLLINPIRSFYTIEPLDGVGNHIGNARRGHLHVYGAT